MNMKQVKAERQRLDNVLGLANAPAAQRDILEAVLDNLAWQRVKLDEAREQMQEESIICEYDNGGGQRGVRENPIFKAYINLWRAYMAGIEKYIAALPADLQEEELADGISILEKVKQMKKGSA